MDIYVIVAEWSERDYGYGGWADSSSNCFEVEGYATSKEAAEEAIQRLEQVQAEEQRKARRRRYVPPCKDFNYVLASEL